MIAGSYYVIKSELKVNKQALQSSFLGTKRKLRSCRELKQIIPVFIVLVAQTARS